MKTKAFPIFLLTVAMWLLTACSGAAPKQIAAAPRLTPIARFPGSDHIVYHAYLELQVSDVERSIDHAIGLAERYGGYFTGAQSWTVDGREVATVELAAPTVNFDRLRQSLLELGLLLNETVSSRPAAPPPPSSPKFSTITLHLRPDDTAWAPIPVREYRPNGWSPANTFRRAWGVFLSIFGFLADILIWVVVVAGPFVLIAVILWRLVNRRRAA